MSDNRTMESRSFYAHEPAAPTVDQTILRATAAGTSSFRKRFESRFVTDFFRQTKRGPVVSSIGIGTYLGESTDDDDLAYETAVRHAIGRGINLIDTAINYRCQRSERAVGAAIQQAIASGQATRQQLVISSKAGYIPLDKMPPATRQGYQAYVQREFIDQDIVRPEEIVGGGHSLAPRFLRYCLAKSRQNLGLRTIDMYYLHNPEQQLGSVDRVELRLRLRAAFTVMEESADRGEIAAYGCATWNGLRVPPDNSGHLSLEELMALAREIGGDSHHFRAVQLPVNLAMPEAIRMPTQRLGGHLVPAITAATEMGLTVLGSASLMQGKLAANLPGAVAPLFPECRTDAQRAIEFVRAMPGVTAALFGARQADHIDDCLACAERRRVN